jgi:hypothetical protein
MQVKKLILMYNEGMNGHFEPITCFERDDSYFTNNITKKTHIVIHNVQPQQSNGFLHNKLKRCKLFFSKTISND